MEPTPFTADLSDDVLNDLRARLRATRWPGIIGADSWQYGVPQGWLQDMVAYWANEWEWTPHADAMNRWQHYRVTIDEVPIHYVHAPAKDLEAPPLLVIHGWPWTFWDFKDVIGPLSEPEVHEGDASEAFNVYVVSLPGFGFSVPLDTADVDVAGIADRLVRLMTEVLGFERFGVHGGDWGGLITAHMAHAHADRLLGAHMSIAMVPGVDRRALPAEAWAENEQWMRDRNAESEEHIRSHVTVHLLDPQTLAYGLIDSPAGTAAWIWERRRNWSDCDGDVERAFDRDHLCTTATLYWATGAIASSLRLYHEHFRRPWPLTHDRMPRLEAACAYAVFPKDVVHTPRSTLEEYTDLRRYTVMPRGGHFGAAEEPGLVVDDLRAFFHGDLGPSVPS